MIKKLRGTETVWSFSTARFRVELELERLQPYRYDGDDETGETQEAIDNGELVAFDSLVRVWLINPHGEDFEIAWDSLGGSVYGADSYDEFFKAHRDSDAMNRNCSLMRDARGANVVICHYFPDMVRNAIRAARETMPRLRAA